MKFRVWCLSWDDDEYAGTDIVRADAGRYEYTRDRIASYLLTSAADAAETYADYCHNMRDGWEATWPLKFRVRSEDGTVQDFEVEREMAPQFSARPLKERAK